MSVTDPSVEPAQPEQGQGGEPSESSGGSPWESYLERFPEEVRDVATEAFREMEGNATKRFQDHAEFRKTWEPFEQLGVNKLTPDEVQWALEFRQAAVEDPQAVWEWAQGYAKERGLTPEEVVAAAQEQPSGDEDFFDPSAQQLEKLLGERLGPLQQRLEQFEQQQQQAQQQTHERQISEQITAEVNALKEQHAAHLPEEVRDQFEDIIERFGMRYAEPGANPKDVVAKAWADFESLSNQLQTAALQAKVNQPAPAQSGGTADVTPEKITTLKQAGLIAKEQLRANRAI